MGVGVEAWGDYPQALGDERVKYWPEMSLVVPLLADGADKAELLAGKRVILPRIPVAGERVDVAGSWAVVQSVRWRRHVPAVRRNAVVADGPSEPAREARGRRL